MAKVSLPRIRNKFIKAGYPGIYTITPIIYYNIDTNRWISVDTGTGEIKKGFMRYPDPENDSRHEFVESIVPITLTPKEREAVMFAIDNR